MTLKQGTLVKYAAGPLADPLVLPSALPAAAAHCYWDLKWFLKKIESNLIGIVLETRGNKEVKVKWLGINKTFVEYEEYLEIVK